MQDYSQIFFSSITLACIYGLVAAGFAVIYRGTGLFNFSHGYLMVLGGYFFFAFAPISGSPIIAAVCAIVISGIVGALLYLVVLRRTTGGELFPVVIATFGLGLILEVVITLIWGNQIRRVDSFIPSGTIDLPFGAIWTRNDLMLVVISAAILVVFVLFLERSRIGVTMRAVGENSLLASQCGANVVALYALTWALAAGLAAVAGILYAQQTLQSPGNADLGLRAFPAALIGGIESVPGSFLGALVVAFSEGFVSLWIGPEYRTPITFALLLVVLLVRPYGLFGVKDVRRV
jgi:branched-chain amino acid transport system permease protein